MFQTFEIVYSHSNQVQSSRINNLGFESRCLYLTQSRISDFKLNPVISTLYSLVSEFKDDSIFETSGEIEDVPTYDEEFRVGDKKERFVDMIKESFPIARQESKEAQEEEKGVGVLPNPKEVTFDISLVLEDFVESKLDSRFHEMPLELIVKPVSSFTSQPLPTTTNWGPKEETLPLRLCRLILHRHLQAQLAQQWPIFILRSFINRLKKGGGTMVEICAESKLLHRGSWHMFGHPSGGGRDIYEQGVVFKPRVVCWLPEVEAERGAGGTASCGS
ncbi:hypothetical protein Vadar_006629 [Vaccinium darrowii]|uniref:Uncharacterized protein n=1 Tax=Vaccinium darrowii TaxID=229202 RepID=A0ACB7X877_9ERIC|nr:hypothetical protein Vadar_006629 [Vaccinium darrowii]